MHLDQSAPLYSAKDLLNFVGCSHSTALDMLVLHGDAAPPSDKDDAYLESSTRFSVMTVDHEPGVPTSLVAAIASRSN